jgi:hypothetical protein
MAKPLSVCGRIPCAAPGPDRIVPAVDLFGIVGQADRLDHRALLQRLPGALHFQVLDEHDRITIGKHIAAGIVDGAIRGHYRCDLRRRAPFAGCLVIDVVVVAHGCIPSISRKPRL